MRRRLSQPAFAEGDAQTPCRWQLGQHAQKGSLFEPVAAVHEGAQNDRSKLPVNREMTASTTWRREMTGLGGIRLIPPGPLSENDRIDHVASETTASGHPLPPSRKTTASTLTGHRGRDTNGAQTETPGKKNI